MRGALTGALKIPMIPIQLAPIVSGAARGAFSDSICFPASTLRDHDIIRCVLI